MFNWFTNKKEEGASMSSVFKHELGKEARDKITGFTGIIIGRVEYLFGCNQYGLSPKIGEDGAVRGSEFFDEGRIEIVGDGVAPEEVQVEKRGGINRDSPRV